MCSWGLNSDCASVLYRKSKSVICVPLFSYLIPVFWRIQSKEHIFRGHGDSVDQLCWHPNNPDHLATASGDKTVRIWDSRTNKAAAVINTKGEQNFIYLSLIRIHISYIIPLKY